MRFAATLVLCLAAVPALAATDINELNWSFGSREYPLPVGNATYTTGAYDAIVTGAEAAEYSRITQGHDLSRPDAVIVRTDGLAAGTEVILTYEEIGYLRTDDWEETVDPDAIMDSIRESTAEANRQRTEGHLPLTIDGWLEEPHLDRESGTVYWAVALHDTEYKYVNAVALKFGRKGYTHLMWVGEPGQFADAATNLEPVLTAYAFNEGFTYADFDPAVDTVAAVGAGALVLKMLTGSTAGKGFLVAALLFLKKFWFLLFIPVAALWRWLSGRKKTEPMA